MIATVAYRWNMSQCSYLGKLIFYKSPKIQVCTQPLYSGVLGEFSQGETAPLLSKTSASFMFPLLKPLIFFYLAYLHQEQFAFYAVVLKNVEYEQN